MASIPVKRVSEWAIKRRFNCGGYLQEYLTDSFRIAIRREGKPDPELDLPAGSVSRELWLFDSNDNQVAKAHCYVLPNGKLAASGYPDPKRIYTKRYSYRRRKSATPVTLLMRLTESVEKFLAKLCLAVVNLRRRSRL